LDIEILSRTIKIVEDHPQAAGKAVDESARAILSVFFMSASFDATARWTPKRLKPI